MFIQSDLSASRAGLSVRDEHAFPCFLTLPMAALMPMCEAALAAGLRPDSASTISPAGSCFASRPGRLAATENHK